MEKPALIPATIKDYSTVKNMARFYVYDMSRYCGFLSDDWKIPGDGLYESYDFKSYFEDSSKKAFLIKIGDELAGFALIIQTGKSPAKWYMGEFFVLAKFQGTGVGQFISHYIWETHPGLWEISVIPENIAGFSFWQRSIDKYMTGNYILEKKLELFEKEQYLRQIFTFDTNLKNPVITG